MKFRIESDRGTFEGDTPSKALLALYRAINYGACTVWLDEDGVMQYADSFTRAMCGRVILAGIRGEWVHAT